MSTHGDEVPVEQIVGSVARPDDFDADFTPACRESRARIDRIIAGIDAGTFPDAVDLVQLGELYFVRDGHHRIAAARSLGWVTVPAAVTRICTIAFAMACLRAEHLLSKGAERRFLERVPLPDDVRRDLWLDRPADWARLTDAAEGWAHRQAETTCCHLYGHDLATAWWEDEVLPAVRGIRRRRPDLDLTDLHLYVAALAARDSLGQQVWSNELAESL